MLPFDTAWKVLFIFTIFVEFIYSYYKRDKFYYRKKIVHTILISFFTIISLSILSRYIGWSSGIYQIIMIFFIIDRYICKKQD